MFFLGNTPFLGESDKTATGNCLSVKLMKKSAAILTFILLLQFLIVNAAPTTKAQDTPTIGDGIKIWSPFNRTYAPNDTIAIKAQLDIRYAENLVFSGNYTLDNRPSEEFYSESFRTSFWSVTYGCVGANATLPKLSGGQHKLTIYMSTEYPDSTPPWVVDGQATVYFTISTEEEAQNIPTYGDAVTIYSPCNKTYNSNKVIAINASGSAFAGQDVTYLATYSIDGHGSYTMHTESRQTNLWPYGAMVGTAELPSLPEGQHKLSVYLQSYTKYPNGSTMSGEATVYFTIIDLNPPEITLNVLDGAVFNQTCVPLNFTVSEPTSWSAYSLDNGAITDLSRNATLIVTAGSHTIIVYANDTAGNMGQSKVATFTVQLPEGASEPQIRDIAILIAAVLVGTAVLAAILLRYKKGKGKLT